MVMFMSMNVSLPEGKKNQKKLSERFLKTDATYKLNWLGFPVFVFGKSMVLLFYVIFVFLPILCFLIHVSQCYVF